MGVGVDESRSKRADSEGKTGCGDEPPRANLLAENVAGNFEEDVANVLLECQNFAPADVVCCHVRTKTLSTAL